MIGPPNRDLLLHTSMIEDRFVARESVGVEGGAELVPQQPRVLVRRYHVTTEYRYILTISAETFWLVVLVLVLVLVLVSSIYCGKTRDYEKLVSARLRNSAFLCGSSY